MLEYMLKDNSSLTSNSSLRRPILTRHTLRKVVGGKQDSHPITDKHNSSGLYESIQASSSNYQW
jgi:hypothetical protein